MSLLNISALKGAQPKGYDYEAAQKQLVDVLNYGRKITAEMYIDKQNRAAANIKAAGVEDFKILLSEKSTTAIFNYLATGDVDVETLEKSVEPMKEESFCLDLCKTLIKEGVRGEIRPLFKGADNRVKITFPFLKGKLVFLLPREEELMQMISDLNLI